MFDTPIDKKLKEGMKAQTKFISIVIRNFMEDFHWKHLTDDQMRELNPIIRNAVYAALYSSCYYKQSDKVNRFLEYHASMIPAYWEDPELPESLEE